MRPVTARLTRIVIRRAMLDVTTLISDYANEQEFGASCGKGGKSGEGRGGSGGMGRPLRRSMGHNCSL